MPTEKLILVIGKYDPKYNRTRTLLSGFRKNGYSLIEMNYSKSDMPAKREVRQLSSEVKWTLFPSFTHNDILKYRRAVQSPIIFDPLISKYMTKVLDYGKVKRWSPRAAKNFFKDRFAMNSADVILADTHQHKAYFHSKFGVPLEKIYVLPIGINPDDFYPVTKKATPFFNIGFYGGFIPLQGVSKIIDAANLLRNYENIKFTLIGSGFEYQKIQQQVQHYQLTNINFKGWKSYEELNEEINQFDLCLGIFGDTIKTEYVIPNKIYHYAACNKPILTKNTPAIKEMFTNREDIYLCESEAEDIANSILKLKEDTGFRNKLSDQAYHLALENYTDQKIVRELLTVL